MKFISLWTYCHFPRQHIDWVLENSLSCCTNWIDLFPWAFVQVAWWGWLLHIMKGSKKLWWWINSTNTTLLCCLSKKTIMVMSKQHKYILTSLFKQGSFCFLVEAWNFRHLFLDLWCKGIWIWFNNQRLCYHMVLAQR